MDPLRLNVMPRGKGYVAVSRVPEVTAVGASPEEAAENARRMAIALYAKSPRPTTLIVRLSEPGLRTIIMQPIEKIFSLEVAGGRPDWRYMASITDNDAATRSAGE